MNTLNLPDKETQERIATALEGILESLTELNESIAETVRDNS